ncbi:MAG TPA: phosphatase PAP2 family protein, partial [Dehalococcoidia bacterium]|nr:phosphatase PAP2 family protein [Dehalococcoidia bacterium]
MDRYAFHIVNNLAGHNRLIDDVMIDWSKGGPLVLGMIVVAAWFLLPARSASVQPRRLAFISVVAALAALGLAQLVSHEWFRERPYVVAAPVHLLVAPSPDGSFPSDHAVGGFALATPLLLDRRARRFGLVVLGGALLLALSRVYVGTHYPGDV